MIMWVRRGSIPDTGSSVAVLVWFCRSACSLFCVVFSKNSDYFDPFEIKSLSWFDDDVGSGRGFGGAATPPPPPLTLAPS